MSGKEVPENCRSLGTII